MEVTAHHAPYVQKRVGEAHIGQDLFNKVGPVTTFNLCYDRAGRSEGLAFVSYQHHDDALAAIREFDGANANGQRISLSLLPDNTRRGRNPFDTAVMPGRPLSERVTVPDDRSRSNSPRRMEEEAARKGIDRYVPNGGDVRSRSPMPQRRGRRPGRRDPNRGQDDRGATRGRPKKTQEELDAEMADYFNEGHGTPQAPGGDLQAAEPADDMDMIE